MSPQGSITNACTRPLWERECCCHFWVVPGVYAWIPSGQTGQWREHRYCCFLNSFWHGGDRNILIHCSLRHHTNKLLFFIYLHVVSHLCSLSWLVICLFACVFSLNSIIRVVPWHKMTVISVFCYSSATGLHERKCKPLPCHCEGWSSTGHQ